MKPKTAECPECHMEVDVDSMGLIAYHERLVPNQVIQLGVKPKVYPCDGIGKSAELPPVQMDMFS